MPRAQPSTPAARKSRSKGGSSDAQATPAIEVAEVLQAGVVANDSCKHADAERVLIVGSKSLFDSLSSERCLAIQGKPAEVRHDEELDKFSMGHGARSRSPRFRIRAIEVSHGRPGSPEEKSFKDALCESLIWGHSAWMRKMLQGAFGSQTCGPVKRDALCHASIQVEYVCVLVSIQLYTLDLSTVLSFVIMFRPFFLSSFLPFFLSFFLFFFRSLVIFLSFCLSFLFFLCLFLFFFLFFFLVFLLLFFSRSLCLFSCPSLYLSRPPSRHLSISLGISFLLLSFFLSSILSFFSFFLSLSLSLSRSLSLVIWGRATKSPYEVSESQEN